MDRRTIASRRSWLLAACLAALLPGGPAHAHGDPQVPLVPESFVLAPAARAAIDAEFLTEEERSELRVFHGVWDERDLRTPALRARVALEGGRYDDPAFADETVPVELRAEALLRRGELQQAVDLLAGAASIRAARLRAEALETLGEYEAAGRALSPVVAQLLGRQLDSAADLTDGVAALTIRARIEGQPARDYQTMMSLLARAHQMLDRLYWPATLAEAELLVEKSNSREAAAALHETLALNPRCARAWYLLGRVALDGFDLDGTARAVAALRRIDPQHPLARLLHAESRLTQNDPDEAQEILDRVIARWPGLRAAHALSAAAAALEFDPELARAALDRCDALSPRSAEAYYTAGRFLSMFRQHDEAAEMLATAIEREPRWPAPQLELGLMEMQTGRDAKALTVLEAVVELDPFDKRAANSLKLLEELTSFAEVETEHFVIRYKPGIDEVLVDLMPEALEKINRTVTERFEWQPARKTIIEVMPDHKRFAVRITGMPHLHTIAACTGPIIALEPPRDGPPSLHRGPFDWKRVIQHEYTHTITLDQTRYRIPHWLTEAAAVSMEQAPRDFEECVMLAAAYNEGTLFDLDDIKWAFVRPKRPGDRGKAYAQGHWMVEFLNETFGDPALVVLLGRYFQGEREEVAIPNALGVSREQFFRDFLGWAGEQVKAWGLAPEPSLQTLTDELRGADPDLALAMVASQQARLDAIAEVMTGRVGRPARPGDRPFTAEQWPPLVRPPVKIDDAQIAAWRRAYPDHPDLLREDIGRRLAAADEDAPPDASLIPLLEHLAEVRPVDLFPHKKLAQIYLAGPDPTQAIPHLEQIDAREEKTPVYARQLAILYRQAGRLDRALDAITRAVCIEPYRAEMRELAAAIAVEAGRLDLARTHVKALTLLEPDRPQHKKRMERIEELMGAEGSKGQRD